MIPLIDLIDIGNKQYLMTSRSNVTRRTDPINSTPVRVSPPPLSKQSRILLFCLTNYAKYAASENAFEIGKKEWGELEGLVQVRGIIRIKRIRRIRRIRIFVITSKNEALNANI
jgi:hypothetical protein